LAIADQNQQYVDLSVRALLTIALTGVIDRAHARTNCTNSAPFPLS